jgi:hypothetical protein
MKIIMRIQIGILSVQIWFLQNEIENGFGCNEKYFALQRKKLMKSILKALLKQ